MLQLTDTQLLILSAPSQRDDRGVELPTNVRGGAARKVVDKLVRAGLLEQIRASGSLPIWQRDEQRGPIALRITKDGLAAIDVEGGAAVLDAGAVLAQNRTSLGMLEFLRARPSLHSHGGDSLRLSSIFEFRVRSRASLELELIALRHQVTVLRQQHPGRPHLSFLDRLLLRSAVYIYERRAV